MIKRTRSRIYKTKIITILSAEAAEYADFISAKW